MTKDDVLQLLEGEKFCVLATAGADGKPEAAFIGFSVHDDLQLVMGTSTESRKYQNLKDNPSVALVFNFDGKRSLQFEGVASEIGNEPDDPLVQQHFAKLPAAEKFKDEPGQTWFVIKPTWLRLVQSDPWHAEELILEAA